MPSQLTRVVFRNIIANKPLLYRGCLNCSPRPRIALHDGVRTLPFSQRRTLFEFLKPRRKMKPMDMPPGFATLSDLVHFQRTGERPPPPDDVAKAFMAFFRQKEVTFEDFHIRVAENARLYLQEHRPDQAASWFTKEELNYVFYQVLRRPAKGGIPHLDFGQAIHEELKNLLLKNAQEAGEDKSTALEAYETSELPKLVQLLSLYGATAKARDIAEKSFKFDINASNEKRRSIGWVWTAVLAGFNREGNAQELIKTTEIMNELSIPFTPGMQKILVTFFAEQRDLEKAKFWYLQPTINKSGFKETEPMAETYTSLLKACAFSGDLTFGHEVVASLLKDSMPRKEAWDAVFVWSAAIGKGVDEVERMINVMVRRNEEARQKDMSVPALYPDVETINALVELSMFKKDPYSAERFISLGEKLGVSPNGETFAMQILYRLSIKDLDGARAAFFNLQGSMSKDEIITRAINRLVQALCASKNHHFDDIMAMVDDMHEHKLRFAPQTIAALCVLHLSRGEKHDAIDLLQVHAHHFSPGQRLVIRNSLAAFILDGQTSTADAWDTYQILRNTFPETPRDTRISIMNEFFSRKRSDMACHVFFHMRNHTHDSISANKDVYVAAFTGFARCADAESLELAHNQMKLDMHIELDTQLRNSLMLALGATGKNKRALEIWAEIAASEEGPSYSSIAIAFRSCEGMPFGDAHAKRIWKRLKELDVEIDKQIWTAYMSAISRNHLFEEAKAMVETVEEEYGFTPDLDILGNWFNTTRNIERQARVQQWIMQRYPAVWKELEALGHKTTMGGLGFRLFNLNRDIDP